jgi:chromosomal replication initiation ATPase DnaA
MTQRVRLYACIEAANHGTTIGRVLGACRSRPEVLARWEVMRRLREDGFSTTLIGHWLHRDHTTVLHGLQQTGGRR